MPERVTDRFLSRSFMCHRVGKQNGAKVPVRDLYRLYAFPVAEFESHFFSAPNVFAACLSALTTGSSSPVRKRISAPPPVQM